MTPEVIDVDPSVPSARDPRQLEPRAAFPRQRLAPMAGALGVGYVFRALGAAVAGFPMAAIVGASGIQGFERGDARLFERGGLWLLELLLRERALLAQLLAPIAALLAIAALASIVPEWLVLRALRPSLREAAPPPEALSTEAARTLPRLLLVALATWTARVVLVLATVAVAMTARSYFVAAEDERLPLIATSVVALLGAITWACLSMLHDVAAIEVATRDRAVPVALNAALEALRQRGFRLAVRYGLMLAASAVVLAAAAAVVSWLDVAQGDGARTAGAALAHQTAILTLLVLRAVWLSGAATLLAAGPPSDPPAQDQADAFL